MLLEQQVDGGLGGVRVERVGGAGRRAAAVEHQHVDPAERLTRGVGDALRRAGLGEVGDDAGRGGQHRGELVDELAAASDDDHVGAFGGEGLGGRTAEAGGRAEDEGDLVVQAEVRRRLLAPGAAGRVGVEDEPPLQRRRGGGRADRPGRQHTTPAEDLLAQGQADLRLASKFARGSHGAHAAPAASKPPDTCASSAARSPSGSAHPSHRSGRAATLVVEVPRRRDRRTPARRRPRSAPRSTAGSAPTRP